VIALNKPPNLITQGGHSRDWSIDDICDELQHTLKLDERPMTVHRLDKPTTGAYLLARNSRAARDLSQQLAGGGRAEKVYFAVVGDTRSKGVDPSMEPLFQDWREGKQLGGRIDEKLAVTDGRVQLFSHKGKARSTPEDVLDAVTEWGVVGVSQRFPLALLRLKLLTGRKHQLRVHLTSVLGTPIVGDRLYSQLLPPEQRLSFLPTSRLFLHSSCINIDRYRTRQHGGGRSRVSIYAPIPRDIHSVCKTAGIWPFGHSDEQPTLFTPLERNGGITINDLPVMHNDVPELGGWTHRPFVDHDALPSTRPSEEPVTYRPFDEKQQNQPK
jgi:23S rRNA-/tRNA-specific pseudouridylate synthase